MVREAAYKVAGYPPTCVAKEDWKGVMREIAGKGFQRTEERERDKGPRPSTASRSGNKEGALIISWGPNNKNLTQIRTTQQSVHAKELDVRASGKRGIIGWQQPSGQYH